MVTFITSNNSHIFQCFNLTCVCCKGSNAPKFHNISIKIWNTHIMILTGGNQSTQSSTCPTATLSTTNLAWTGLGSNLGLQGKRPRCNHPSHDTAYRKLNCIKTIHNRNILFLPYTENCASTLERETDQ